MSSTGPTLPGTLANNADVGSIAWTNPANAGASDNAYAVASFTTASPQFSNSLRATNFGFALPVDATVAGIVVQIERKESAGTLSDNGIQLLLGGALVGTGRSRTEEWATSDETVAYGDARDLWGRAWTAADINDSTFGVSVRVKKIAIGVTRDASIDAVWLSVYYSTPADNQTTVVRMRAGRPPHGARVLIQPAGLRYAWKEQGQSGASFYVSRSFEQMAQLRELLFADRAAPPMVTIEPPRGDPWVGFVTEIIDEDGDPYVGLNCADHWVKLGNSSTQRTGTVAGASGYVLVDTLREIDQRTPLYLRYDGVLAGPAATHTFRGDEGDAFVKRLEEQTGYRLRFASRVSEAEVTTHVVWRGVTGEDKRRDPWIKDVHFTELKYHLGFLRPAEAVVVAGAGAWAGRSVVVVGSGQRSDLAAGYARTGRSQGAGSRVYIRPQLGDAASAVAMGQAMLDSPENAAETLSMSVYAQEPPKVGELRRVHYEVLGAEKVSDVRIIGVQVVADSGVYDVESVVLEAV